MTKRKDVTEVAVSTAHVADACLRLGLPVDILPSLRPVLTGSRVVGRAVPVQHSGSVDVFLEALEQAGAGDVLVVDNAGRTDEACVGDLVVLECRFARLAGVVVWGLHRDTAEIRDVGLPVFSLGACPSGPRRLDARRPDALEVAVVGPHPVRRGDLVVADDDGVVLVDAADAEAVLGAAESIRRTEVEQAARVRAGTSLREQLRFAEFLDRRDRDREVTFRRHLRDIAGAIEE